ncbi:MAG: hypothetical protein ACI4EI_03945 [Muricoprocola sp.]
MMISIEEAKALAATGEYGRIPLSREIYSDIRTPMEVLRIRYTLRSTKDPCL